MPWTTRLQVLFITITKLYQFFRVRPSVVDPRVKAVSITLFSQQRLRSTQSI